MTGRGEEREWDGLAPGGDNDDGGEAVANGTVDGEGFHEAVPDAPPSETGLKAKAHAQKEKQGQRQEQEYPIQTHQARTWGELFPILDREEVRSGKGLCMIEVFMQREDAPESLKRLVANVVRRNSGQSDAGEGGLREGGKVVEEKVIKAAG